jgi:hypothetical protein
MAGEYVILAKAGISTVPNSIITGNIAVSPIAATAMTGFSLTADSTNVFSTSSQLTGRAFAANYVAPTPATLTAAVNDMEAAYTEAAARLNTDPNKINLGSGLLGVGGYGDEDNPLTPGVYTFHTDVSIASDIYFNGTYNDVFIIQITGDLKQAVNTKVILTNCARAENIFWQITGYVDVGMGAHLEGILLGKTKAMFKTGSSLYGRVLAQTACTLDMATITEPAD